MSTHLHGVDNEGADSSRQSSCTALASIYGGCMHVCAQRRNLCIYCLSHRTASYFGVKLMLL